MNGKKVFITGGAGFIGSNLCDELLNYCYVTVYDNLSTGREEFLKDAKKSPKFKFIHGDVSDYTHLKKSMEGHDFVFHLSANPDVRIGVSGGQIHFRENVENTFKVLEAMRELGIRYIAFASTSTVYGLAEILPTPENYGPNLPISIYGGSKAACEAMISAYTHTYDFTQTFIFRFANIIGKRSTHGVIYDFINKLKKDPKRMEILGDGKQNKSYLHISDCIGAMLHVIAKAPARVSIYNIGSSDSVDVLTIAKITAEEMGLKEVEFQFAIQPGGGGWKGDVPRMALSIEKIKALGWQPTLNSSEAVRQTVKELLFR
ncbi:MAG: NAD-dependent epimerase/dehydratase family protein [Thermoplasmata archaeon]